MSTELKKWLATCGAGVLFVLLVWFGVKVLTLSVDLSATAFFVVGCLVSLGGILVIAAADIPPKYRLGGFFIFLIGVYYFARAGGVIERPIVTRLIGFASLVAAVMITATALKYVQQASPPELDQPDSEV